MSNNHGQNLAGKIAVVTGGSSGIGLATAKRFVEEGAQVVITGRREKEPKEAATFIKRNVTTVVSDVSRLEDLDRLYAVVKEKHGHIDVLFANAGAGTIAPLAVATEAHFDQTFDVNVKGLFFTVQKALPLFKDGGSIILNSSVSNVLGLPGFSTYAASKAAVRNFARAWTMELKDRKIRVNSMSPGPIETPALETTTGLTAEQAEQAAASFPRRSQWVAGASLRKSLPPLRSSPPMKVLSSPALISPSMEAWRRSDPGAVASRTLVLTRDWRKIMSYAIVGFGKIGQASPMPLPERTSKSPSRVAGHPRSWRRKLGQLDPWSSPSRCAMRSRPTQSSWRSRSANIARLRRPCRVGKARRSSTRRTRLEFPLKNCTVSVFRLRCEVVHRR